MEGPEAVIVFAVAAPVLFGLLFLFWRFVWFFRNPERTIPQDGSFLSPADGTVVYVQKTPPQVPVISTKRGRPLSISDIVQEDLKETKLLVGIFMSPFDVHYNRAPLAGRVAFVHHHPARDRNRNMTSMHWRSLLKRFPIYEYSRHLIENERSVTKIEGTYKSGPVSCYVVQIAGGHVHGIDSYVNPGRTLERGQVFGMIRIGSQVDLVLTWRESMKVKVKPGDRVYAGSSVLVD